MSDWIYPVGFAAIGILWAGLIIIFIGSIIVSAVKAVRRRG